MFDVLSHKRAIRPELSAGTFSSHFVGDGGRYLPLPPFLGEVMGKCVSVIASLPYLNPH